VQGNLCQINHQNNYRLNNSKLFRVDFSPHSNFTPTNFRVKSWWKSGEIRVEISVPGDLDRAFSTRDTSSSLSVSDKYAENKNHFEPLRV